ncbi:hypothetical protein CsatB_020694 [Cannabis sativa]
MDFHQYVVIRDHIRVCLASFVGSSHSFFAPHVVKMYAFFHCHLLCSQGSGVRV